MSWQDASRPGVGGVAGTLRLRISVPALLAFAYGATTTLYLNVVGQLYFCEMLALITIAIVGPTRVLRESPALFAVVLGYLMMLSGLIVADVLNANSVSNALRGWANVSFGAIDVMFLTYVLKRDRRALIPLLIGYGTARILNADLTDVAAAIGDDNYFKTRIMPFLTPLVLVLAYYLRRFNAAEALMLAVGLAFVVIGARSTGLMFFASGLLLLLLRIPTRGGQRGLFALLALALGYVAYTQYVDFIFATQVPGQHAYDQLARATSPYNPFSLLAQGRAEFRVAIIAIGEAWIVGRGSWAQDITGAFSILQADLQQARQVYFNPFIASHSVVLTAWLWGGLLGLAGIAIVIVTALRHGVSVLRYDTASRTVIAFLFTQFLWNVLFSPVGHIRTSFPLALAAIIVFAEHVRGQKARYLGNRWGGRPPAASMCHGGGCSSTATEGSVHGRG